MLAGVRWGSRHFERKSDGRPSRGPNRHSYRSRSIQFLRDVHQAFGTSFKIVPADKSDPESPELLFSCYGTGYVNANRTLA